MTSHEKNRVRVIVTFLVLYIPLVGLMWGATHWFISETRKQFTNTSIASTFNKFDYIRRFNLWQLSAATDTSEIILNQLRTYGFEGTPSAEMIERIEAFWIDTMVARKNYLQFRLLDLRGQELARVDYDPATGIATAPKKLQFKGSRDYVQRAFQLDDDELLITVPEANQEWGKVSQPVTGVIRIIRPILQADGKRDGYVLVNLSVRQIQEYLAQIPGLIDGGLDVVDAHGFYIASSNFDILYGHQIAERRQFNFSQLFPDVWKAMQTQQPGVVEHENEIFVFKHFGFGHLGDHIQIWPNEDIYMFKQLPRALLEQAIADEKQGAYVSLMAASVGLAILLLPASFLIALRRQRNRESRLAKVAMDSMCASLVTDTQGYIVDVNKRFTDITGYRAQDVRGKSPHILSSGKHDKAFFKEMWSALLNQGAWAGEIWNRRKTGEIYPQLTEIQSIRNPTGTVTHFAASFIDITKQKKIEQDLREASIRDPLTGCLNRRGLADHLDAHIELNCRHGSPFSLAILDIDFFKKINDNHGHDAGDKVLIEFVQCVESMLRQTDIFARSGGEEFILLMPMTTVPGAAQLLERIHRQLAKSIGDIRYTFSAGVTVGQPGDDRDAAEKRADIALYSAKNGGRDQTRIFAEDGQHLAASVFVRSESE